MFKFLISLLVLIVVVGGLWWSGLLSQWIPAVPTVQSLMQQKPAANTEQTSQTQQNQPQAQAPVNDLPTAANDASDSAIAQDAASVDAQMSNLNTDSASAQSSLDDKPVTQEY